MGRGRTMGSETTLLSYLGDIDIISNKQYDYQPSITDKQIKDFIRKLMGYGLMEHEIQVMVDRFVFNKTFSDIAKDNGFVDTKITFNIYKKALKKAEKAVTYLREFKG